MEVVTGSPDFEQANLRPSTSVEVCPGGRAQTGVPSGHQGMRPQLSRLGWGHRARPGVWRRGAGGRGGSEQVAGGSSRLLAASNFMYYSPRETRPGFHAGGKPALTRVLEFARPGRRSHRAHLCPLMQCCRLCCWPVSLCAAHKRALRISVYVSRLHVSSFSVYVLRLHVLSFCTFLPSVQLLVAINCCRSYLVNRIPREPAGHHVAMSHHVAP